MHNFVSNYSTFEGCQTDSLPPRSCKIRWTDLLKARHGIRHMYPSDSTPSKSGCDIAVYVSGILDLHLGIDSNSIANQVFANCIMDHQDGSTFLTTNLVVAHVEKRGYKFFPPGLTSRVKRDKIC